MSVLPGYADEDVRRFVHMVTATPKALMNETPDTHKLHVAEVIALAVIGGVSCKLANKIDRVALLAQLRAAIESGDVEEAIEEGLRLNASKAKAPPEG